MPIGASKLGVLGAGLVPGGSVTFNSSGNWDVPPGVKKVSITGKGGTGNPGVAGNPGNPGNPGTGGTGGGGGAQQSPSSLTGSPGGGSWNAGIICNPLVNTATPFPNNDNNTGFHPSNPNANISPLYRAGGQGRRPGPGAAPQPGNAGSGGNAGSAGQAGQAGNAGQQSTGLGNTFPGGAGGNAPPGGNAGNAGTAGNGGGAGNPGNPSNPGNSGSGGNGGGSGGTVNVTPPSTSGLVYVTATGGGGAGITNDGQTGLAAATVPSPVPFASQFERFALGGTYSQASAPILEPGVPFNNPRVNPSCTSFFGPRSPNPSNNCYITNAPVNTVGGMGSSGGGTHAITTAVKINQSQQEPSQIPLGYLYPLGFAGPGPVNFPAPRRWLTAWNPAPLRPELFRAGAGGGGIGSISQTADPPPIFRSGGAGGGGGRGNAGNAGGPSPTISGQAANPSTFNCVTVTPGATVPIVVGSPGGQIVISWNPQ